MNNQCKNTASDKLSFLFNEKSIWDTADLYPLMKLHIKWIQTMEAFISQRFYVCIVHHNDLVENNRNQRFVIATH